MLVSAAPAAHAASAWSAARTSLTEALLGAPGSLTVVANPPSVVADGNVPTTVTVTLRDGNGQVVPQESVELVVSGSSNRLGSPFGTTDAGGTFVTTLRSSQAGTKSILATAGAVSGTGPITFVAGPPESRQCSLSVLPGVAQAADGNTDFLVVASLRDRFSNPVPGYTVTPTSDAIDATFQPPSGTTKSDGTFSTQLSSYKAGRQNLSLMVGTGRVVAQASFFGGAPNSLLSTAVLSPNTVLQADGLDAFLLSVTLVDDHQNPVVGYPVSMSSDGVAVMFSPREGSTNSLGVFNARIKSHYIGTSVVRWAAGTQSGTQVVTFKVGAPKAITSTVVMQPSPLVADGNSQATITGTIRDASGNPVPALSLTFSVSGQNNTLTTPNCLTDAAGSCTTTITSTQAETKIIVLSNGTFKAKGIGLFVAGNANFAQSSLSVNTQNTQVANGYAGFIMGAKLFDMFGNPVGGQPVTLTSSVPQDIFKPTSGKTSTAGIFNFQVSATTTGPRTVMVDAGGVALQANVRFGVGPLSPGTSTFTAVPAQNIVADGATASTITAQLRDAQGRPLAAVPLTLSATGASNVFSNAAPVTDSNGLVTVTLTSTHAEVKKLTLTAGRVNLGTVVTFIAGSPNQAITTVAFTPAKPAASLNNGARVRVTVLDSLGNACNNIPITFSATGSSNSFASATGTTNVFGAFTTTFSSIKAENKIVSAQVGAFFAKSQNVTITSALPSDANTTLTVTPPGGVPADGASTLALQVAAKDAFNNPVVGQVVALYAADRFVVFAQKTGFTDNAGMFSTTAHASTAGTRTVTAQLGGISKVANLVYKPVVVSQLLDVPTFEASGPWGLPRYDRAVSEAASATAFNAYAPQRAMRATAGSGPWALHIERDEAAEWVVIHPDEPRVAVHTQVQDTWHTAHVPLPDLPQQLLSGDFNGDGVVDLAVVLGAEIVPLLGQPQAGYEPVAPLLMVLQRDGSHAVAVTDCNGDGLDDLTLTSADGQHSQVHLSLGDGRFTDASAL